MFIITSYFPQYFLHLLEQQIFFPILFDASFQHYQGQSTVNNTKLALPRCTGTATDGCARKG